MTKTERAEEFNSIFESLPGKNIEKIRRVCEILHYKENTVRIYRTRNATRVIPERQLKILRSALAEPSAA